MLEKFLDFPSGFIRAMQAVSAKSLKGRRNKKMGKFFYKAKREKDRIKKMKCMNDHNLAFTTWKYERIFDALFILLLCFSFASRKILLIV